MTVLSILRALHGLLNDATSQLPANMSGALQRFLRKLIDNLVALVVLLIATATGGGASATPAGLTLIATAGLADGNHRYVISNDQFYILDLTSTATVDGLIVVATDVGGATGRWIQYPFRSLMRSDWWIDQLAGSDANGSGAQTSPIATYGELQRRIGVHRGQLSTLAQITVHQVGNWTGNAHLDLSSAASGGPSTPPIIQGELPTPGAGTLITVATVLGGVQRITTALALVAGDIIRNPVNGATARVIASLGANVYQISQLTLAGTGIAAPPVGGVTTIETLPAGFPVLNGRLYGRDTEAITLQHLDIVNTLAGDAITLGTGDFNLISCRVRGSSAGNNRLEQGTNVISSGSFYELTSPLLVFGRLQLNTGNLATGGAGFYARPGGRLLIVGGTAAAGDGNIGFGDPGATQRSYFRVAAGAFAQIGNDAGTAGQLVTLGGRSGIWLDAGATVNQTIAAPNVPTGTVLALGEGVRIDTGASYLLPLRADVPTIVPATVGNDVNVGGYFITYASVPATVGLDTPGLCGDGVGGTIAGTAHAMTHVRNSPGLYTFTLQKAVSSVTKAELRYGLMGAIPGANQAGMAMAWVGGGPTTCFAQTTLTVMATGVTTPTDTAFSVGVLDPTNGGTGARMINLA